MSQLYLVKEMLLLKNWEKKVGENWYIFFNEI